MSNASDLVYAPRGKLLKQCGPCKAIAQWEKARSGYVNLLHAEGT